MSEDKGGQTASGDLVRAAYVRALVARGVPEAEAVKVIGDGYSLRDAPAPKCLRFGMGHSEPDRPVLISTRKMRAHFWELVELLRPSAFTVLRQSVYPLFECQALAHFSKRLQGEASRFSLRHDISMEEVRDYSATLSLRRDEDADLNEQLRDWQTSFNLTDDWCGGLALKTMQGWLWPEQSREEESTSEVNWLSEDAILEFRLNSFQHGNVLYEYVAWNGFFDTTEDWLREETARFKAHLERLRGKGRRIPYAALTAFQRALKADLALRKRELERALDTPLKVAAHFEWLVRHQVPEVESYRRIAKRPNARCAALGSQECAAYPDGECTAHPGVGWTTVRAGIESALALVGLTKHKGSPAGRPRGKTDSNKRLHIVARGSKNRVR